MLSIRTSPFVALSNRNILAVDTKKRIELVGSGSNNTKIIIPVPQDKDKSVAVPFLIDAKRYDGALVDLTQTKTGFVLNLSIYGTPIAYIVHKYDKDSVISDEVIMTKHDCNEIIAKIIETCLSQEMMAL